MWGTPRSSVARSVGGSGQQCVVGNNLCWAVLCQGIVLASTWSAAVRFPTDCEWDSHCFCVFLGDLECKALATKCTGYRTTAYSKERRQHFARSGTIFISPSPQFHADSVQEKPVLSFLVLEFFHTNRHMHLCMHTL